MRAFAACPITAARQHSCPPRTLPAATTARRRLPSPPPLPLRVYAVPSTYHYLPPLAAIFIHAVNGDGNARPTLLTDYTSILRHVLSVVVRCAVVNNGVTYGGSIVTAARQTTRGSAWRRRCNGVTPDATVARRHYWRAPPRSFPAAFYLTFAYHCQLPTLLPSPRTLLTYPAAYAPNFTHLRTIAPRRPPNTPPCYAVPATHAHRTHLPPDLAAPL